MAPSRQLLISVTQSVKALGAGDGVLSVVVIARNEADRLGRCLASVAWAAERLVIDSGSRDGTPRIARAHGARVVHADWPGFGAQRNRGLVLASHDWVLFLDADEWLEADGREAIEAFLVAPDADGARLPRRNRWLGRPLAHGRAYPDRQLRLVRRGRGHWSVARVHEHLQVPGAVRDLTGHVGHEPYRDLSEHWNTVRSYSRLASDELGREGRSATLGDVLARPPLRFVDAYLLRAGFRDGRAGLAVAGLGALYCGMKWGRRWRAQRFASGSS